MFQRVHLFDKKPNVKFITHQVEILFLFTLQRRVAESCIGCGEMESYDPNPQYNYNQYYNNYYHNYFENYNNYDYSYNHYNYNYEYPNYQQDELEQDVYCPPFVPADEQVLAIPSIINRILSSCSIKELKRKRLVCKKWNEEVHKLLQENLCIQFHNHETIKRYLDLNRNVTTSFLLGPNIPLEVPIVYQFFATFGPYIRSLIIKNEGLKTTTLEKILCQNLSNLEKLSIPSGISFSATEEIRGAFYLPKLKSLNFLRSIKGNQDFFLLKSLLKAILHSAPNLIKVEATGIYMGAKEPGTKSFEISDLTLPSIMKFWNQPPPLDAQLWSALLEETSCSRALSNINLNVQLTQNCVHLLNAKQFPLKSIDLKISPEISNNLLHNLLNNLKETLVNIKLQYFGDRLEYETDLPISDSLQKVKSVQLESYQGSLSFVEKIPNLVSLAFKKVNLNKVVLKDGPLKREGINVTLKSLEIHQDYSTNCGSNRQRSVQTVQKLGMQFPSVKKLRLERLVDESLCLIYAQWPNLEDLEIVHGSFTDAGTTAINPNAYKVMLREDSYETFNVEVLREGLYLGNLANLTTLKISSPYITDVTVVLGILACPNIHSVSIQSNQIRDTSLYRLLNKLTIMNITSRNCSQLSPQAINYVSSHLKKRGGTSSLNFHQCNKPLDVGQIIRFLGKNPKPKVLLKRLSAQEIIEGPNFLLKKSLIPSPIPRKRGRPPLNKPRTGVQLPKIQWIPNTFPGILSTSSSTPFIIKRKRGRPPLNKAKKIGENSPTATNFTIPENHDKSQKSQIGENSADTILRKRGRPKRVCQEVRELLPMKVHILQNEDGIIERVDITLESQPRFEESVHQVTPNNDLITEAIVVKRKRGRPPKAKKPHKVEKCQKIVPVAESSENQKEESSICRDSDNSEILAETLLDQTEKLPDEQIVPEENSSPLTEFYEPLINEEERSYTPPLPIKEMQIGQNNVLKEAEIVTDDISSQPLDLNDETEDTTGSETIEVAETPIAPQEIIKESEDIPTEDFIEETFAPPILEKSRPEMNDEIENKRENDTPPVHDLDLQADLVNGSQNPPNKIDDLEKFEIFEAKVDNIRSLELAFEKTNTTNEDVIAENLELEIIVNNIEQIVNNEDEKVNLEEVDAKMPNVDNQDLCTDAPNVDPEPSLDKNEETTNAQDTQENLNLTDESNFSNEVECASPLLFHIKTPDKIKALVVKSQKSHSKTVIKKPKKIPHKISEIIHEESEIPKPNFSRFKLTPQQIKELPKLQIVLNREEVLLYTKPTLSQSKNGNNEKIETKSTSSIRPPRNTQRSIFRRYKDYALF